MANEITKVEYKSMSDIPVKIDSDTVRRMLVKGDGRVTDAEVAFFLRTCQAKRLDPFEEGEVSLIKYGDSAPAQMVVGYQAYVRRADYNPEYRGYKAGITVLRQGQVIQKEGACVYKALEEKLIGGWCRVFRERNGYMDETFMEVALDEYDTGKSNWKSKPATMIRKVAISQAFRNAFPTEYEGLYTTEEMVASGAVPVEYDASNEEKNPEVTVIPKEPKRENVQAEAVVNKEQRRALFDLAKTLYGEEVNSALKDVLAFHGYDSTTNLPVSVYNTIMGDLRSQQKIIDAQYTEVNE